MASGSSMPAGTAANGGATPRSAAPPVAARAWAEVVPRSVRKGPARTTESPMPMGSSSARSASERPTTANFDPAYKVWAPVTPTRTPDIDKRW